MPGTTNDLHGVLDDYRKFLREKNLAPPAHQPYLVRWVRDFLLFAQTHRGYTFEQTLDLFLAEVGARVVSSRGNFSRRRTPLASTVTSIGRPPRTRDPAARSHRFPTRPQCWDACGK